MKKRDQIGIVISAIRNGFHESFLWSALSRNFEYTQVPDQSLQNPTLILPLPQILGE